MRPKKLVSASRWALILAYLTIGRAVAQPQVAAKFENDYVLYEIGTNGTNLCFVDKATGTNYVKKGACAVARIAGKYRGATAAAYRNGRLTVTFGATGATATVGVTVRKHCILFEIDSLAGAAADRLICPHVPLTLPSTGDASFAACVLALNLRTNVPEIPGPSSFLRAFAYRKLGIEGERYADYSWPYGGMYQVYRELVRMNAVEKLNLYCNNVPAKGEATCYLSPIKAIPIVKAKVRNPAVTIRGKTIRFPVEIETGYCLEYRSPTDCGLYGPQGEFVAEVTPEGDAPLVEPGTNDVTFTCAANGSQRPRAYVSVITEGEALRGRRTREKVRWGFLGSEVEDPRVVTAFDGVRNRWNVTCRSEAHLELELTVDKIGGPSGAYTAPTALPIENFDRLDAFADTPGNEYAKYVVSGDRKGFPTALGVTQKLELYRDGAGKGNACVRYTATSRNAGGWSARGRRFSPLLDLSSCTDIGFRLHGDGKGETLYLQLRDVAGKWFDMKTSVGFTGWKYVEFPLAGAMADLAKIEYLIIYYNSIPAGATVICRLDDVRGLRKTVALANPTVTVNGQTLVFPVAVAAKGRLVYRDGVCKLFAAGAKAGKTVASEGAAPKLRPGRNSFEVSVSGTAPAVFQIRVAVTKAYQR